jgi:hypothetical protein
LSINYEATHWSELIDLSQNGICEPALTENLSDDELKEALITEIKLDLPDLPAHSQSVERAVKMVSEASHIVYGLEARHRHIVALAKCRQIRPHFVSKGSYSANYNDFWCKLLSMDVTLQIHVSLNALATY